MKPIELYSRLEKHDWWYHMSDDHRHYKAGEADSEELRAASEESPENKAVYDDYIAYKSGKGPKPKPPEGG